MSVYFLRSACPMHPHVTLRHINDELVCPICHDQMLAKMKALIHARDAAKENGNG